MAFTGSSAHAVTDPNIGQNGHYYTSVTDNATSEVIFTGGKNTISHLRFLVVGTIQNTIHPH